MMAAVIRSSGTASSLSPASTTERGIPYTTHVSSASVRIAPPRALIQAAPSRPSAPIPVITTPAHDHRTHRRQTETTHRPRDDAVYRGPDVKSHARPAVTVSVEREMATCGGHQHEAWPQNLLPLAPRSPSTQMPRRGAWHRLRYTRWACAGRSTSGTGKSAGRRGMTDLRPCGPPVDTPMTTMSYRPLDEIVGRKRLCRRDVSQTPKRGLCRSHDLRNQLFTDDRTPSRWRARSVSERNRSRRRPGRSALARSIRRQC